MKFVTMVVKNVLRRPFRSALTTVAMAVAICTVVALVGIAMGFEQSFLSLYQAANTDLIVARVGGRDGATSSLPQSLGDKLKETQGVVKVGPGLLDMVSMREYGVPFQAIQGWEPDSYLFDHIEIQEGRKLGPKDERGLLLGRLAAATLGKGVDDTLRLYDSEDFKVVGVFESSNNYEDGMILTRLEDLQEIMAREGQVTGFSLVTEYGDDQVKLEQLREQIETENPGIEVLTKFEHVQSLLPLRLAKAMAWLTSAIALIIGSIGMINTMIMSVYERTREIGLLRAVGWSTRRVLGLILMESVLLSIVGGLLGVALGVVLTKLLTQMPAVSGIIAGVINWQMIGIALAIAITIGLIGGLFPALRGARLVVTEALRHE